MTPTTTRPDDEVRAEDRERVGVRDGDDVSTRAVDVPPVGSSLEGGRVRNRRVDQFAAQTQRAPERGIYLDRQGVRRVVGAGAPIPPGWTKVDDADLASRAGTVETAAAERDTAGPGNEDPDGKADRGSGRDKSVKGPREGSSSPTPPATTPSTTPPAKSREDREAELKRTSNDDLAGIIAGLEGATAPEEGKGSGTDGKVVKRDLIDVVLAAEYPAAS